MSELSTLVKKWTGEIETWVKGLAPGIEADFVALANSFKTTAGPAILAAAENALPLLGEAALGTITGATLVTDLEAIGKNLLTAIEGTAKALAQQGITATTTQIISALAVASANITAATPPGPTTYTQTLTGSAT